MGIMVLFGFIGGECVMPYTRDKAEEHWAVCEITFTVTHFIVDTWHMTHSTHTSLLTSVKYAL